MATAPAFEQSLLDAADSGTAQVIVDLSGCSYFDSTGLKALLATRRHLDPMNRRLSVVMSNPNMLEIFRITGFDRRFEIHPSLKSALNGHGHVTLPGRSGRYLDASRTSRDRVDVCRRSVADRGASGHAGRSWLVLGNAPPHPRPIVS